MWSQLGFRCPLSSTTLGESQSFWSPDGACTEGIRDMHQEAGRSSDNRWGNPPPGTALSPELAGPRVITQAAHGPPPTPFRSSGEQ